MRRVGPGTARELERRRWVERLEHLRDLEEEFERLNVEATDEERRRLHQWFGLYRRAHREADIAAGQGPPGLAITMRRVMWATWIHIAVAHELNARRAYDQLRKSAGGAALVDEFHESLVAISACAHAVEALYGDVKYLVPAQREGPRRHQTIARVLVLAFGIPDSERGQVSACLRKLFRRRDFAVHPYTESEVPVAHPAGFNTGQEHSEFNTKTASESVDAVFSLLTFAVAPPSPAGRWIERWVVDRYAYFERTIAPLKVLRTLL